MSEEDFEKEKQEFEDQKQKDLEDLFTEYKARSLTKGGSKKNIKVNKKQRSKKYIGKRRRWTHKHKNQKSSKKTKKKKKKKKGKR